MPRLGLVFTVLSLVLPGSLPAQSATSPKQPALPKTQLSVDARLVALPVVVRDKKGALVRTLSASDFALSIDGTTVPIRYFDRDSNLPLTLGLLVDTSRSQRNVLDQERTASAAFLDSILSDPNRPSAAAAASAISAGGTQATPADQVFLLQFARQAELLQDLTSSRPKLQASLKEIDTTPQDDHGSNDPNDPGGGSNDPGNGHHGGAGRAHGGTVLYDALFLSADELMKKQHGRKALIVLTDGVDNGSRESLSRAIESLQRADLVVYAIFFKGSEGQHGNGGFPGGRGGGFPGGRGGGGGYPGGGWPGSGGAGRGGNSGGGNAPRETVDGKKILERITDETGGRTFEVSRKQSVEDIYREIAAELRSQYRLGFTPTASAAAEGYHQIDLTIPKQKDLRVQTRDGYYTGAAPASGSASNESGAADS